MKCILELQEIIQALENTDTILNLEELSFFTAITPILCKYFNPLQTSLFTSNDITEKLEKEAITNGKKVALITSADKTHYLIMPFFIHKIPFVIYTVSGKKKELATKIDFVTSVYDYLQKEFHHLKKTRKKAKKAQHIAEQNLLKELHSFLETRTTTKPWYLQTHYPLTSEELVATDFVNLYPSVNDSSISVLCDITAQKKRRYACFVQTDAWFKTLSQINLSLTTIIQMINHAIYTQQGEWHLSAICTRYTENKSTLEICGAGTCKAFLYKHDTGVIEPFTFDIPLGQTKQQMLQSKTIQVSSGDIFFSCTDGIVNSVKRNGTPLGVDFIKNLLISIHMMSIYTQNKKINDILAETYADEGVQDDRTIQLIKFP